MDPTGNGGAIEGGRGQEPLPTMRAIQAVGFGGPGVLQLATVPRPRIGAGEVLIRTAYASVNFADIKSRRGGHHLERAVPFIPGLDVSGTVEVVGEGVEGLEPGQRVAAATEDGAYAEWVRARAILTYPLPAGVTDLQQAAGIVAMMTAYNVLILKAGLQSGESVLVHAAAGGVGSLLLQLARLYGSGRVIAVVGSEWKAPIARDHGADEVIVSRGEGYGEALDALSGGGVDVVLDSLGGTFFADAFARLAPYGRLVTFGNAAGEPPAFAPSVMHKQNLTLIGYSSGTYRRTRPEGVRTAATRMLEHLAAGELHVPIGRVFDLADAAEAHRALESRATTGKLLLRP